MMEKTETKVTHGDTGSPTDPINYRSKKIGLRVCILKGRTDSGEGMCVCVICM